MYIYILVNNKEIIEYIFHLFTITVNLINTNNTLYRKTYTYYTINIVYCPSSVCSY